MSRDRYSEIYILSIGSIAENDHFRFENCPFPYHSTGSCGTVWGSEDTRALFLM